MVIYTVALRFKTLGTIPSIIQSYYRSQIYKKNRVITNKKRWKLRVLIQSNFFFSWSSAHHQRAELVGLHQRLADRVRGFDSRRLRRQPSVPRQLRWPPRPNCPQTGSRAARLNPETGSKPDQKLLRLFSNRNWLEVLLSCFEPQIKLFFKKFCKNMSRGCQKVERFNQASTRTVSPLVAT